jgi:hypothetical protein
MWRLIVVVALCGTLGACATVPTSDVQAGFASTSLEPLLDALLSDFLTRSDFVHDREFYGTAGGRDIVLVNEEASVPWPRSYAPKTLCGWRLIEASAYHRPPRGEAGQADRKLGIRIDMLCLNAAILDPQHGEPSKGPIIITVFNVGGTRGGVQPIGGMTLCYAAEFKDGNWTVKWRGGHS